MTVAELIKELEQYAPDCRVRFSSDEEGNVLHTKADIALIDITEKLTELVIYPLNTDDDII